MLFIEVFRHLISKNIVAINYILLGEKKYEEKVVLQKKLSLKPYASNQYSAPNLYIYAGSGTTRYADAWMH